MSSVWTKRSALALAILASSACNSGGSGLAVASLTRPGDIAFACFDETTSSFLPTLAECAGVTGATSETLRMISFVVETTRGEVGAIDWQSTRAIDSNRVVPGFTFVRVGESPSAIIVPENDSRMTFVANYGSFSVQSLETAAFVPDAVQDVDDLLHPNTVLLPAGPSDLVYVDTGAARWLFAALPDAGAIAQIPVGADGSLGVPVLLAVTTTAPAQVAPAASPEFIERCPEGGLVRVATATPRIPVSMGAAAKPNQLDLVRRPGGLELVASDASLPIVHRFTVADAGLTELAGFNVAVPTIDVLSTPLVPATDATAPDPLTPSKQFVYAIDAIDRSVLVVDVDTGEVVPVTVGDRASDRVPFGVRAIGLGLLTPGYDLAADPTLIGRCDPANGADLRREDVGPTALRGVFVAVSTTDGFVSIVDVFDLDAQCRGTTACLGVGNANDEFVSIRRHRPRVGGYVVEGIQLSNALTFSFDANAGGIASSGKPSSGTGPGLVPIDDGIPATAFCPGDAIVRTDRGQMAPVLVSTGESAIEGQPLICVLDEPSAVRAQSWAATFEGGVPTAAGIRGRLVDAGGGVHRFDTEDATFCTGGAIGIDDIAASGLTATDPEFGYAGDMLVISADVPAQLAADPACADLVIPTDSTKRVRIAFEIREAHADHLVLGNFVPDSSFTLVSRLNQDPAGAFDLVRACFPALVSYDVRLRNAYLVSGSDTTPHHRIVDDGAGRCIVDVAGQPYDPASPDTARTFRALPGRPFVHPQVAFQISDFPVKSGVSARLGFQIIYAPPILRVDGGALEPTLEFNVADQRFYVVDSTSHAVSQFDVDPIASVDRVQ